MPQQGIRLYTLLRALELSGGPDQLARELRLSRTALQLMMNGLSVVPEEIFLRVVDLLNGVVPPKLIMEGKAGAKTVGVQSFRWLPIDAFNRLTPEQKDVYLLELSRHLDPDNR